MDLANSTIAITGSSGFIGHSLCRRLVGSGANIRSLVRYRSDWPGEHQFDLVNSILDPAAIAPPVRAVVHCAWDTKLRKSSETTRINVEGTQWLIDRCKNAGVEQFIFISSINAHGDSGSLYAQNKWEVETRLLSLPNADTFSTVIAAGTVIGKGGMFAKARSAIKRLPVIPAFYAMSRRRVQTVFIDDLCDAILATITNKTYGRVIVADQAGVSLKDFYRGIAALSGRTPPLIPASGNMALVGAHLFELFRLRSPVAASALSGLRNLQHVDVSQGTLPPGIPPIGNYWQSLERLAMQENKPEIAEKIRQLAVAK